ncbi:hypothetical protein QTP88_022338 [Uroleucon formosanum]
MIFIGLDKSHNHNVISAFCKGAKKRRDYYILQKYEVLKVAEKKYLIHKEKEDKADIIKDFNERGQIDLVNFHWLSTSNLPLEVIKKLIAEEDLEEMYCQYEEENLEQDILVKYCNMCKNESTEDVCDLFKTNKTIYEERKTGHAGQEKAAKKMLQNSKLMTASQFLFQKSTEVPTSEPARVISVIIEEKNEMYKVGTTHGFIKGWFNSKNMQHATANFILAEQVNKQKELTLRLLSGGQAFLSCSCKSACQTKKCVCFKGSLKCNSRLNSFSCSNK